LIDSTQNKENKMSDLTVAKTIAKQMGGTRKLSMFVGATSFGGEENALSFRFKGSKKANMVKVTLTPLDLYKVEFSKIVKYEQKEIATFDGIYCDGLIDLFEKTTGLYLNF